MTEFIAFSPVDIIKIVVSLPTSDYFSLCHYKEVVNEYMYT